MTEISYFSDQTRHRNLSNPFNRKKRITVRDLLKIGNHLFFYFLNKTLAGLKTRKNLLHLQKNPPSALLQAHRLYRCVIKCLGAFFPQLPSTDLPQDPDQCLQNHMPQCPGALDNGAKDIEPSGF